MFRNVRDNCSGYGGEVVAKLCYNVSIIGLTAQRSVVGLKVAPD